MGFTTTRPEVSCHPELLVPGARTVVAGALAVAGTVAPAGEAGEGRLPRYAWDDAYGELRAALERLGGLLGGTWRVLVDENDHVDREAAVRAGLGFFGKSTMVIVPGLGTWVVLGALVTDVEVEESVPVAQGCGSCTLCIDACPTGALDEPWVLDAGLCVSWLTQRRAPIPAAARAALGDMPYGCDICQDVCPWNAGPARRAVAVAEEPGGAGASGAPGAPGVEGARVSLVDWLRADPVEVRARHPRLYVQRNDPRVLRRNAAVALGNSGDATHLPLLDAIAAGTDTQSAATKDAEGMVAEHAAWAAARLRSRLAARGELSG
jgi:epoxyqueuosine reductase